MYGGSWGSSPLLTSSSLLCSALRAAGARAVPGNLPGYACRTTGLPGLFRDVDLLLGDHTIHNAVGAHTDRASRGTRVGRRHEDVVSLRFRGEGDVGS